MAKKKSNNKVVPVLVLAAILAGGYYWLTNDHADDPGLNMPGEATQESVEDAPVEALESVTDETDGDTVDVDSVMQQPAETVAPSRPSTAKTDQTTPIKNGYVDEYGNVIYTQPNGKDPVRYKTYTQSRWNYSIQYPTYLTKETYSQNNDGGMFKDGKGRQIDTYASWNVLNESISDLYRKDYPEFQSVTYKKLLRKQNSYVKSGYTKDNRIFYIKESIYELDGQEVVATLIFYYPKSYNKEAGPIIDKIFTHFPNVKK